MRIGESLHVYILLFSLTISLLSCSGSEDDIIFLNVKGSECGIDFRNDLIESDSLNIIQYLYFYNGAGITTGDLNGDHLPDVFFASNQGQSKLYLNVSTPGKIAFRDISKESGLDQISGWSTGVNMVDINGDGQLDIYLCQVHHKSIIGHNQLFINNGLSDGIPVFVDKTAEYGLNFQGLATQSAFFDYDLDGDLDMYLLCHSVHSPENYANSDVRNRPDPGGDRLYENRDNQFIDVSQESGIYSSRIGFGLGLGISDVNKDGYPDIYVGNDFHENDYFYLNNGDGTFSERIVDCFGHTTQFSMGMDIADINNDGWNDILTLDMMPEDERIKRNSVPSDTYEIYEFKHRFGYHYQLPRNNLQLLQGLDEMGRPIFSEIGQLSGIEDTDWSWSALLNDYNNDGLKDLFVTNGIVRRPNDLDYLNYISNPLTQQNAPDKDLIDHMPYGNVTNYLFINKGGLQFEKSAHLIKDNRSGMSTGAASADFDGDGDKDIITNDINDYPSVYINQTNNNDFLRIRLQGSNKNTRGLGAKISVYSGSSISYFEHNTVRGIMSSSEDDIIIGINEASEIDSLMINWPGGQREVISEVKRGATIVLNQANTVSFKMPDKGKPLGLFNQSDLEFSYTHQENNFTDANEQKLMPWLLSTQGPALAVADVNGDGKDDVFFGGAKDQSAVLFFQNEAGEFSNSNEELWNRDQHFEDVDASFFDADKDGDLDLYVVSGGNEQVKNSPFLLDRLYVNDGQGTFTRDTKALPLITENGSSVASSDFDQDGDLDLVLGTNVETSNYGYSKGAVLLVNDGTGKFNDGTKILAPDLINIGMVTDVEWTDLDQDGDQDIVVLGEWMSVTLMINESGRFVKKEIPGSTGLWRSLKVVDLDNDGLDDIIAGNFGTNVFLAQEGKVGLVWGDFDGNRVNESLIYYYNNGIKSPVASRDLLINQMNSFKNLHRNYGLFAAADFDEMFGPVLINKFREIEVSEFETCWYKNLGDGDFKKMKLPVEAQFAPVFAIDAHDYNDDGNIDLVLGGNFYEVSPNIGRNDGSIGLYLESDGRKGFNPVESFDSGLVIKGQVRKINSISVGDRRYIVVARNNDKPIVLSSN